LKKINLDIFKYSRYKLAKICTKNRKYVNIYIKYESKYGSSRPVVYSEANIPSVP